MSKAVKSVRAFEGCLLHNYQVCVYMCVAVFGSCLYCGFGIMLTCAAAIPAVCRDHCTRQCPQQGDFAPKCTHANFRSKIFFSNPTPHAQQQFNPANQASNKQKLGLRVTCARALCSLLQPLCHFNFAPNLCKAVVSKLTSPHADIAVSCRECIASFFATNRSRDVILGTRTRVFLHHTLARALWLLVTLIVMMMMMMTTTMTMMCIAAVTAT